MRTNGIWAKALLILSLFSAPLAFGAEPGTALGIDVCNGMLKGVSDADLKEYASIIGDLQKGYEQLSSVNWDQAVTFFGSARRGSADVEKTARILGENGYVIMSGGGPGVMESANEGAEEAEHSEDQAHPPQSYGLSIKIAKEQITNPYLDVEVKFSNFLTRKHFLHKPRAGFVIGLGGFGTLDELFGLLTLIQTKKKDPVPIVLLGENHYDGLANWIRTILVQAGTISPQDPDLFIITNSPEEAAKFIIDFNNRKNAKHAAQG